MAEIMWRLNIYNALDWNPQGKVAVKISTGEPPSSNYLEPELIGNLVKNLDGTCGENWTWKSEL